MLTSEITEAIYHRLLKRQIRKSLPTDLAEDPRMQEFLNSVSKAYLEFQADLSHAENILEQSSGELFKANRELSRIAEEKTKEAASSNQRLDEVVSSISEVLVQLDNEGRFIYLNPAWETITGFSVEESIGKKLNDYILNNADNLPDYTALEKIEDTVRIITTDHSEKWLGITLNTYTSGDSESAGYIGTFADVTQKVEAEKKLNLYMRDLEKINAELDQFAYVVSHDLKAPLRAINNLSEWIEEDIGEMIEGDTKEQFSLLRGRVHKMESLINGILSYSRIGRIKPVKEKFLIKSVADDLCETFSSKNPVSFHLNGDINFELFSEKIALVQVLQNLISNGIKYNNKETIEISIGWTKKDNQVEIYVRDNGPGISPEFHEKIFVIFQTLQSRDEIESTGVGLAIVKKIIEEKKGSINVSSVMHEGSTFTFNWPLIED
ncbi:MAG TPA: ATP-binding protein [Dyadobacter sp.]|jgi:PAS domain S-box-containing protein|nr:ATP-binding protein [Dyadobacter sp.]